MGGSGFIGYHLAKKSITKKWEVTSISTKKVKKIRYLKQVKYIHLDISKKTSFKKIKNLSFNYVVNLGGYVNHKDVTKTYNSHYMGCKNLADHFLKKKLQAFVQMGSSVEYGKIQSPQLENFSVNPKSLKSTYGKAKLLSTIYLQKLFKKKKFPATILRLYLAYGPKQDLNRLLPIIINSCLNNKKFPCSNGEQTRDFIHVEDVVSAIIKTLKTKKARGKILNLGSGKPLKVRKIINMVKKFSNGGKPQFGEIRMRKDEMLKIYPNINLTKKVLDWKPKTYFNIGLKKTIKSYNGINK